MRKLYLLLLGIGLLSNVVLQAQPQTPVELKYMSTYYTGVFEDGAAEITAFEAQTKRLFCVNAAEQVIEAIDLNDPFFPDSLFSIDITPYGGNANSIVAFDGIIAAAIEATVKQDNGSVVFFDADGNYINAVTVGALPDMIMITEDHTKLLTANEGEPSDDYLVDPEGSVSIIDISGGIGSATVNTIGFESLNGKRASLLNKGVRIFGNNGLQTVAQDLEPEYITVVGNLAYVSCQENNALIVIDLGTFAIRDVLALGEKDHLRGSASVQNIAINEADGWPILGTPLYEGGEPVQLGGFSGLWFAEDESDDTNLVFYTIPDRGPNNDPVSAALVGTSQNLRPYKLPDYQARVVKFTVNAITGEVLFSETEQIYLTRQDGVTPISGKGNIPGFDEVPVTITDDAVYTNSDYTANDVNYHALEYDAFGGDFEGIVKLADGTFWMCDENRPAIYHFDANGQLIERYVPEGTSLLGDLPQPVGYYGAETLPAVYSKRWANRGFEALAYDHENEIIYAFIQSPLFNPNSQTQNQSDVIRILGIDPSNGMPVAEYVYLLDRNRDSGVGVSRVDKIGDAVFTGDGRFLVIERDSSMPGSQGGKKIIFEIDLRGATNIVGTPLALKSESTGPSDPTLEMMTADEIATAGIVAVHKNRVLNLPNIGYNPSDKAEGLAFINDGMIAVLNDNDFGLAGAGITDSSLLGLITFNADYGMDVSNTAEDVNIQPWPVRGYFMPDAVAGFDVNGMSYIVTANEGDSRDYDGYSEEERIKDVDLDPTRFPDAAFLQTNDELGRLNMTTSAGDLDHDGDFDIVYTYGARSFSIFDAYGNLVYDSGDDFEQITLAAEPENFNSTNNANDSFKNRSDDKGPEPEGIILAEINGRTLAFIGLERIGGIMLYDVTDPHSPVFYQYINHRDFSTEAEDPATGDLGPEGLLFIPASESPNQRDLLVLSNEISGTISIFQIDLNNTIDGDLVLDTFDLNDAPIIGAADGGIVYEGGISGMQYIPGSDNEFLLVGDRGPNVDAVNHPLANGETVLRFPFPAYAPKIWKVKAENEEIEVLDIDPIRISSETLASGLPLPEGFGGTGETAWSDLNATVLPTDVYGIDSEGIITANDGTVWVCDEYGTSVWRLDPQDYSLIERYAPFQSVPEDVMIDEVYGMRRPNRGFEGVAYTPNGKIYAILQSPAMNPDQNTSFNSRVHRILEIDPMSGETRTFVYLHDPEIGAIRSRDWKMGDLVAINNEEFMVLEHAERNGWNYKNIYKFSIANATPVVQEDFDGLTLEQLNDETGLSSYGIIPAEKTLVLDLLQSGWDLSHDKPEGLTVLNDSTIAVINDNDFGINSPDADGHIVFTGKTTRLYIYHLPVEQHFNVVSPYCTVELGEDLAFCEGGSVILDASGDFVSYDWSSGEDTAQVEATVTDTYAVVATNEYGCMAIDQVDIEVYALPQPELPVELMMCPGDVELLVPGFDFATYNWSIDSSEPFLLVDADEWGPGEFEINLDVTSEEGCENSATVNVQIGVIPVINFEAVYQICEGDELTLDAGVGEEYSWSNGEITQQSSFNEEGPITVSVTTMEGCVGEGESFLIVNELPNVDLGDDLTICSGDIAVISAGSYESYDWSSGEVTQSIQISEEGVYSVVVTDVFGCEGSDSIELFVEECVGVAENEVESGLNLYPNPVASVLSFDCFLAIPGAAELMIFDQAGRVVYMEQLNLGGNAFSGTIDLSDLSAGMYTFRLTGSDEVLTSRFVKE